MKSILAVMAATWKTAIILKLLKISFAAALQMLDQLQDFASSFADTEMQCQLATITEKLQDVRLQRRKHASIKDFFSRKFSV